MYKEVKPSAPQHTASRHINMILGVLLIVIFLILSIFLLLYVSYRTSVDAYRSNILTSRVAGSSGVVNGFELPSGTSNIPKGLSASSLVSVVAKNQPAVVRILTIKCADIEIKLKIDSVSNDICIAGVGSGSIISSDGYISTNGHVVTLSNNSLVAQSITSISKYTEILQYLLDNNLITSEAASSLLAKLSATDTSSETAALIVGLIPKDRIVISNSDTKYSAQLSNEPIRLDSSQNRLRVRLGGSIKDAKLIDEDFDIDNAEKSLLSGGGFDSSDVAILKIDGEYPFINLGSIDSLSRGETLTAVGFPAFVDGSVDTAKWQTVPSVTQGIVKAIVSDSSPKNRKLITSDVQVAQGSSGGPAFDQNGLQIGLNTYANIKCADSMCFGDATIRDIADIKALLSKNNIILNTYSEINNHWYKALDNYELGNFSAALSDFEWVQDRYAYNYLSSPLAKTTRSKIGSGSDLSPNYAKQSNVYQISIITLSTFLTLSIISVSFTRYLNIRHRRVLLQSKHENSSK